MLLIAFNNKKQIDKYIDIFLLFSEFIKYKSMRITYFLKTIFTINQNLQLFINKLEKRYFL